MYTLTPGEVRDKRDLVLDVLLDAPIERVFEGWTRADVHRHWYPPSGWKALDVRIDARAGGQNRIAMIGPAGERIDTRTTNLLVLENEQLVFTDAYDADWQPSERRPFMTVVVDFAVHEDFTRVTLRASHWRREDAERHLAGGFNTHWTTALQRLEGVCRMSDAA